MSLLKTVIKTIIFICLLSSVTYSQTSTKAETTSTKKSSKKKVEVFVTSWCPYCKKLENQLQTKGVTYTRYDIEKSEKGLDLYRQMGLTGGVPVTKIGSQVVRGANIDGILSALAQ